LVRSHQEPVNKITANPNQAAVIVHRGDILFTSALAEISSSKTLVLEKAPLRPQRSVAVPHPGQLLMMQTLLTYISPTSSRGHFATTFSALRPVELPIGISRILPV